MVRNLVGERHRLRLPCVQTKRFPAVGAVAQQRPSRVGTFEMSGLPDYQREN